MAAVAIYLDNAASAPLDARVARAMQAHFGSVNPASDHEAGQSAAAAVEAARVQVAAAIGAEPEEIVFTSGATEANNLAILGSAGFYAKPGHMVSVATEHPAVLEPLRALARRGWQVDLLPVDAGGRLDCDELAARLRADTALVSVMQVNNETGVYQDLASIAAVLAGHDAAFHIDAAQGAGRLNLDLRALGVDLLSLSGHKLHGPQGVGALFVRRRPAPRISPVLHGGGQENGLRPGTVAVHQVAGLGAALELAAGQRVQEMRDFARLREELWRRLSVLDGAHRNGEAAHTAPWILNVSFEGVHGEALQAAVGWNGLAVSSGSACTSSQAGSSHVLRAMGIDAALAAASLRFSLGRGTGAADIAAAADLVVREVTRLRDMAPARMASERAAG